MADTSPVVDKKYRRSLPYKFLGLLGVLGLITLTVWSRSEYQSTQDREIIVLMVLLWIVVSPPVLIIVLDSIVGYVSIGTDSIQLRSIFGRKTIEFSRINSVEGDPEGLVLRDAKGNKLGKVFFVTSQYTMIKRYLEDTFSSRSRSLES